MYLAYHKQNIFRNQAVSALKRLLIALRYYATGSVLLTVADFGGVCTASAHTYIEIVTLAIAGLLPRFVKMPEGQEEEANARAAFFQISAFPGVIGAIDCTHARLRKSPGK